MAEKIKDNTNEIMKNEKMINVSFNPKQVLKRLAMIIMVTFWIISIAKPSILTNMVSKVKEKKVETNNKEIVRLEKTDKYTGFLDDGTYVSADDLSEFAEKLSGVTGKVYACEDGKLKAIDGGVISVVEITVYKK